jgi:hypothetical protein
MQCHPSGSWARKWLGGPCYAAPLLCPLKAMAESLQVLLHMLLGSRNTKSEGGATFCQTTLSLVGVPPGSWTDLPGEASLSMGTVTNIGMML